MDIDARLDVTSETCDSQLLIVEASVFRARHMRANHLRDHPPDVSMMIHLVLFVAALRRRLDDLCAWPLPRLRPRSRPGNVRNGCAPEVTYAA